jgi:hypothetical protein
LHLLVRYIHLNPIRANLVHKVDEYPYSGHRNYVEGRVSEVLDSDRVLDMVGGRARYRRFVGEGLRDGHREYYYQVEDQRFLGAEEFAKELKRKADEETPRRKKQLRIVFRSAARAVANSTVPLRSRLATAVFLSVPQNSRAPRSGNIEFSDFP